MDLSLRIFSGLFYLNKFECDIGSTIVTLTRCQWSKTPLISIFINIEDILIRVLTGSHLISIPLTRQHLSPLEQLREEVFPWTSLRNFLRLTPINQSVWTYQKLTSNLLPEKLVKLTSKLSVSSLSLYATRSTPQYSRTNTQQWLKLIDYPSSGNESIIHLISNSKSNLLNLSTL